MKNLKITISIFVLLLTGTLLSRNPINGKELGANENLTSNQDVSLKDQDRKNVKKVGMVIKIKPERLQEYLKLHEDTNPGVRDLLTKYKMRNFPIFMTQLEDGNYYEFGYYEYWGKDFEADMAALSKEPRNAEWLKVCDPMQIPLQGETSWKKMGQVYFNY
jgi:L-rhamnose mutarotase